MPIRMPKGKMITIQKRDLPADYCMPQMEMAEEHYSLGYLISGDRHVITPMQQFDYHPGDVSLMPPLLYHRTVSHSSEPYISFLVKIAAECKEDFCERVDRKIWDVLYEQKVCSFTSEQQEWIEGDLEDMLSVYSSEASYADAILQGMLYRLLIYIYENRQGGGAFNFGNELSSEILEALYHIEKSYGEELTLEAMAAEAGFSTAYFSRQFKAQLGVPFSEYLTNVRVRHVQELLTQTDRSISEIALETGFCNGDYLAARFRQRVGMTPTAYRKNLRKSRNSEKNKKRIIFQ